jgi:hypothetical protein
MLDFIRIGSGYFARTTKILSEMVVLEFEAQRLAKDRRAEVGKKQSEVRRKERLAVDLYLAEKERELGRDPSRKVQTYSQRMLEMEQVNRTTGKNPTGGDL